MQAKIARLEAPARKEESLVAKLTREWISRDEKVVGLAKGLHQQASVAGMPGSGGSGNGQFTKGFANLSGMLRLPMVQESLQKHFSGEILKSLDDLGKTIEGQGQSGSGAGMEIDLQTWEECEAKLPPRPQVAGPVTN